MGNESSASACSSNGSENSKLDQSGSHQKRGGKNLKNGGTKKGGGRSRSTCNFKTAAESEISGASTTSCTSSDSFGNHSTKLSTTTRTANGCEATAIKKISCSNSAIDIHPHHHQSATPRKGSASATTAGAYLKQNQQQRKHSSSHLLLGVESSQSVDSGCGSTGSSTLLAVDPGSPMDSNRLTVQSGSMMVNNWLPAPTSNIQRKHSFSEASQLSVSGSSQMPSTPTGSGGVAMGTAASLINNKGADRRRSRSLCAQQLKADCQAVANQLQQQAGTPAAQPNMNPKKNSTASSGSNSGSSSGLMMPSLARLRIQQCFKNAKPIVGQHILKRACSSRSELKAFLAYLADEKVDELASDIHELISECVASLEEPDRVSQLSKAFGQMHAQLCQMGFRPEFFSTIADATIAECVRLDGGAHKRCETLLAWSQLMQFMFSNVRDGYYAEVRQQRRSSLPQHRLLLSKQQSIDVRNNCSFDMDL